MSERHREAWLGRFAVHADATNRNSTNYARPARDLAPVTYAICSSCTHNKTAKNRFAPSFFGHSGPAKAARRGAGLDQIGSSRHG
jgi:hypothetical protein